MFTAEMALAQIKGSVSYSGCERKCLEMWGITHQPHRNLQDPQITLHFEHNAIINMQRDSLKVYWKESLTLALIVEVPCSNQNKLTTRSVSSNLTRVKVQAPEMLLVPLMPQSKSKSNKKVHVEGFHSQSASPGAVKSVCGRGTHCYTYIVFVAVEAH